MSGKSGDEARGSDWTGGGNLGNRKTKITQTQVDLRQVETDVQSVGLKLKVVCVSKNAIKDAFLR